jgi:hypothetical protein
MCGCRRQNNGRLDHVGSRRHSRRCNIAYRHGNRSCRRFRDSDRRQRGGGWFGDKGGLCRRRVHRRHGHFNHWYSLIDGRGSGLCPSNRGRRCRTDWRCRGQRGWRPNDWGLNLGLRCFRSNGPHGRCRRHGKRTLRLYRRHHCSRGSNGRWFPSLTRDWSNGRTDRRRLSHADRGRARWSRNGCGGRCVRDGRLEYRHDDRRNLDGQRRHRFYRRAHSLSCRWGHRLHRCGDRSGRAGAPIRLSCSHRSLRNCSDYRGHDHRRKIRSSLADDITRGRDGIGRHLWLAGRECRCNRSDGQPRSPDGLHKATGSSLDSTGHPGQPRRAATASSTLLTTTRICRLLLRPSTWLAVGTRVRAGLSRSDRRRYLGGGFHRLYKGVHIRQGRLGLRLDGCGFLDVSQRRIRQRPAQGDGDTAGRRQGAGHLGELDSQ